MSGHCKWSTIKHKKGALDAKRGKIFSQISKDIRVAVKSGGEDEGSNPRLRTSLEKARTANMPKENIQRALDRGMGRGKNGTIAEVVYEGFGPGGVGMMIVAMTDNRQRTSADVKSILAKSGGSLGSPGSAAYMFERDGEGGYQVKMAIPADEQSTQKLEDLADELRAHDDVEDVYLAL